MCVCFVCVFLFFFKQKTAYEVRISDWSSDVCSSDLVFAVDGAVTAADTTFTSATAAFAAADVGKLIKVGGAGASGATLITTIASVNSGTSVELADAAGTTVTGANYTYGTDDLTAVENARAYCWAFTNSIRGGQIGKRAV